MNFDYQPFVVCFINLKLSHIEIIPDVVEIVYLPKNIACFHI